MTARLTRFRSRNGVSEVQSRRRECRALREALPYETPTPRPAKPRYRMKSDFVPEGQAPRLRWRLAMTKPTKMAVPELTMVRRVVDSRRPRPAKSVDRPVQEKSLSVFPRGEGSHGLDGGGPGVSVRIQRRDVPLGVHSPVQDQNEPVLNDAQPVETRLATAGLSDDARTLRLQPYARIFNRRTLDSADIVPARREDVLLLGLE